MSSYGRGKGKVNIREVRRLLELNGYRLDRVSNHFIYKKDGDTFILPRSCHALLLKRMYKEHNIKTEEELKKKPIE